MSGKGSWVSEETGWKLHPDLDSKEYGPHWDAEKGKGENKKRGRIYPDSTYEVKN